MTTGKPQQLATESNSSDDLIAELSKLMAQDAHGSRRDVAPPQAVAPSPDSAASAISAIASAPEGQVTPFSVRIPGANPPAPQSADMPPAPRFDFGRVTEPVAVIPREEPSFAPVAAPSAPAAASEPPSFNFDFGVVQRQSEPQPQLQPVVASAPVIAPAPAAASASANDHDTIADLIAAELMGEMPAPTPPAPAAPGKLAPVEPVAAAPQPGPPASEPPTQASWTPTAVTPNLADRPAQSRPTLRPVNLTPIHKADAPGSDSFRIPPVFGLGTTTPPPAANTTPAPEPVANARPRAEHGYLSPVPHAEPAMAQPANDVEAGLDPIDEIESLIGRAVRVELDNARDQQGSVRPPEPVRSSGSPALRSLATPTAPQPALHPVSSADETIMAAAAATGAEIGWVDHAGDRIAGSVDDEPQRKDRAPRRAGMLRAAAGPLVAVVLLLAAGFGLYSVLGLGGSDGPAPVLVADTAPIKQVPETKSPVEQLQQSVVFNEMDGVVPGAEEQLVSRDQADVNEVTAIPPTTTVTDEGLANRKVRTVTVRPDGSIVSGEDSVAGTAILPVDRPNVPAVPGASTASNELLASADATEPTPAPTPTPVAAAPVTPLVPGSEIAVVDATGAPVAGKTAPVPYVRPASVGDAPATGPVDAIVDTPQASVQPSLTQPVSAELRPQIAPTQNLTAAVQQPQAAPVATQPTSNAAAYAQLSSQRSPEVAQQVAKDLSARYASLLNGVQLEISRADLGERGTYYRVRVPAASQANAAQFCAAVKANGGDCLAM